MNILLFVLGMLTGVLILQLSKHFMKSKPVHRSNRMDLMDLADSSKDVIYHFQFKPEPKYLYISPSIEELLGPGLLEACYQNPFVGYDYIHPEDMALLLKKLEGKIDYSKPILQRWKDHTGKYKWTEEYATPIYENGELVALMGFIRDVSERVELQQELRYLSSHDILTGIYNRNYFEEIMNRYNNEIDCPIAFIVCDLDELKGINDAFGHARGDELIRESAKKIHEFFSDDAIVARIGGDEFVIVLPEAEPSQVETLCKEFEENIANFNANTEGQQIRLSMGYAYTERSLGNMEALLTKADKRMYRNKNDKKRKQPVLNC